ncbi:hypothetical protein KY495_01000 [Massilia sp. PAMC28688]|uniref:hypothetical protein n=1 Tax=Massilia sp. PAMC28688 TaxID=2861283 RepID=UPI001C6369DF|nr:hypothetical protein [Massilia sp. PAMC28688]QYF93852.1 hypothetical protein KY495_01000 [Massilia sp. PAMC28688]
MNTTMGNGRGGAENNISRDIARVLAGTGLLLLVPLAAMQFTDEVVWTLSDFVFAALLIAGTGIAYVLIASKVKTSRQRMITAAVLACVFLTVWAELAVGLLD